MEELDLEYNKLVVCPFCGTEEEDCLYGLPSGEIRDEAKLKWTCSDCDAEFAVTVHIDYTFTSAKPADTEGE